jgi:hypothetical protein
MNPPRGVLPAVVVTGETSATLRDLDATWAMDDAKSFFLPPIANSLPRRAPDFAWKADVAPELAAMTGSGKPSSSSTGVAQSIQPDDAERKPARDR